MTLGEKPLKIIKLLKCVQQTQSYNKIINANIKTRSGSA